MKKMFIILTAMLLLLAACESNTGFDSTTPFIGGTQGLKISFVDSFPPATVSDGGEDPFDIIVKVTNRGEADVEPKDVLVTISGFPASQFGRNVADLTSNSPELIERNLKNPDGSIVSSVPVEVEFNDFAYQNIVQGNQAFPVRADICYKYSTQVSTSVCVKEDFRRDRTGDICTVSASRQVFNSAAPIQITRMTQSAAGSDRTRVSFTIENRDQGRVFETGYSCASDARRNDRIFLRVSGFSSAQGEEVSCRGLREGANPSEGYIVLSDQGVVDITCDISFSERSPRIQPFNIELVYDYNENIQKNVIVERN
ncbi:MAG: hypothetical protein ACMXX9_00680 [Candidatus Woesearchaeota archaeon]